MKNYLKLNLSWLLLKFYYNIVVVFVHVQGELDTMRNMALEIETLRIQLTEVRKQLIKVNILLL